MRKPFSFTERSKTVFCANAKCSQVRGAEGISRMAIKENVVARQTVDKPLVCYDCAVHAKTGKTRKQRKEEKVQRKLMRQVVQKEQVMETMVATA